MAYIENLKRFEGIFHDHGWNPGHIWVDGKWHPFDTVKQGDKAGRYRAFSSGDFVAGCIWDWKSGLITTWNSGNGSGDGLSDAEMKILNEKIERSKKDAGRRTKKAVVRAKHFWNKAKPADPEHSYLAKKGVQPNGIRQFKKTLLVPVLSIEKELRSIQFISNDGSKRFLKDGKISGNFYWIKGDDTLCLCEGFATGASIYEATGYTVLIAFNAGNLAEVAKKIKAKYQNRPLIICGDNDDFTTKPDGTPWNPGREKALAAAWDGPSPDGSPPPE